MVVFVSVFVGAIRWLDAISLLVLAASRKLQGLCVGAGAAADIIGALRASILWLALSAG